MAKWLANYLAILALLTATGCGARLIRSQPMVTLWPPKPPIEEVVAFLELYTCDFMEVVETNDPTVLVRYDNRNPPCRSGGASNGRISIMNPACDISWEVIDGIALHELLHVLGHWHHDEDPGSVMATTVGKSWEMDPEDFQWVIDTYCKPAEVVAR